MGWSSGTNLMERIVEAYEGLHNDEAHEVKVEFYKGVIEALEDHDWDTEEEVLSLNNALDDALEELGLISHEDPEE